MSVVNVQDENRVFQTWVWWFCASTRIKDIFSFSCFTTWNNEKALLWFPVSHIQPFHTYSLGSSDVYMPCFNTFHEYFKGSGRGRGCLSHRSVVISGFAELCRTKLLSLTIIWSIKSSLQPQFKSISQTFSVFFFVGILKGKQAFSALINSCLACPSASDSPSNSQSTIPVCTSVLQLWDDLEDAVTSYLQFLSFMWRWEKIWGLKDSLPLTFHVYSLRLLQGNAPYMLLCVTAPYGFTAASNIL